MASPVLMPRPGQMTEECTVVAWLKREGDVVRRGDVLFEIETDKATMEVEAFDEGTLVRIVVGEGTSVPVNSVVAWVGAPGEAIPEASPVPAPDPAARATPTSTSASSSAPTRPDRMAVSPRAARVASELGIDPRLVTGSGPSGRIVERDVRGAVPVAAAPASSGPVAAAPAAAAPDAGEPRPMGRLRQVIARRLTESATTIPHFSVTVAVDMTGLVALRSELRVQGSPVTLTDFIHAATVQALLEFPLLNARTDGRLVWERSSVHLGVAVSVPGGLLVPVVRDAQAFGLRALHDRTTALVEAARAGRLGPDDLEGSTFTVSNMGMFEVEGFTAIINPGESGILAVGSVTPDAVAVGDGLAVRQMMRLTLSADHRLIDGELGARFVNTIRRRLQDVEEQRAVVLME